MDRHVWVRSVVPEGLSFELLAHRSVDEHLRLNVLLKVLNEQ